jgi:CheY-like chemotaxis protein
VLIADDDPPLLSLLRTLIGRDPRVQVVACRDGEEAIRALSSQHFDVVLLDLMMPHRSGLDVIDFLRRHRPEQLRVVLVLSAAADELTRQLDPGVVHTVIAKPFDTSAILDIVRGVLDAAEEVEA